VVGPPVGTPAIEDNESTPRSRNNEYIDVSGVFGIAASNIEERTSAYRRQLDSTPVHFENCQGVPHGGVLFLVPFLVETGLLTFKNHYKELDKGYYYIEYIVMLLSFMYLCRIKNPERLKNISAGEFGKLMGLDRVPEAKCLRKKIKQISGQRKSTQWNMALARDWSGREENEFYYIDGHVQVYHGYKATLGKKHVSRQKLCLPGIQEFWVNNADGMPYFYVTGQVNEKLQEMIRDHIIGDLLHNMPGKYSGQQLSADPDLPRFTIVFDREAYSPVFFKSLWDGHRIAVITYRKNVKDKWPEEVFADFRAEVDQNTVEMKLAERPVVLNGVEMREIRSLSEDGHQSSVITTNRKLSLTMVAVYMFARWAQENFFRYLRQDYDFDRLLQYAVGQLDSDIIVNNPEYNKLCYFIKKTREKINRRKAALYDLKQKNADGELDNTGQYQAGQIKAQKELDSLLGEEQQLLDKRSGMPSTIKIKDMPESSRYNTLQIEGKHFQNILKMICYRAETSMANLLAPFVKKSIAEKRTFVKNIIKTTADLQVDGENEKLIVLLYSQATPRANEMVNNICELLNQTETIYPGTNLKLFYKLAN
jgi:hypothetical protein